MILRVLCPFILDLIVAHVEFILLCNAKEEKEPAEVAAEFILRNIMILLALFFLYKEVVQLTRSKAAYFLDFYNYTKVIAMVC